MRHEEVPIKVEDGKKSTKFVKESFSLFILVVPQSGDIRIRVSYRGLPCLVNYIHHRVRQSLIGWDLMLVRQNMRRRSRLLLSYSFPSVHLPFIETSSKGVISLGDVLCLHLTCTEGGTRFLLCPVSRFSL